MLGSIESSCETLSRYTTCASGRDNLPLSEIFGSGGRKEFA